MNEDPTLKELVPLLKILFSIYNAAAVLATVLVGVALKRMGLSGFWHTFIIFCVGWYGGQLAGKAYLASIGK